MEFQNVVIYCRIKITYVIIRSHVCFIYLFIKFIFQTFVKAMLIWSLPLWIQLVMEIRSTRKLGVLPDWYYGWVWSGSYLIFSNFCMISLVIQLQSNSRVYRQPIWDILEAGAEDQASFKPIPWHQSPHLPLFCVTHRTFVSSNYFSFIGVLFFRN